MTIKQMLSVFVAIVLSYVFALAVQLFLGVVYFLYSFVLTLSSNFTSVGREDTIIDRIYKSLYYTDGDLTGLHIIITNMTIYSVYLGAVFVVIYLAKIFYYDKSNLS